MTLQWDALQLSSLILVLCLIGFMLVIPAMGFGSLVVGFLLNTMLSGPINLINTTCAEQREIVPWVAIFAGTAGWMATGFFLAGVICCLVIWILLRLLL